MYINKQTFTRYLFLILLLAGNLQAQEKLSLEQAVQLALENNFDIKLNKNDVEQAKNNVSRANAGMLPIVTGNFSTNNTVSNTKQTLSSGQQQERNGAEALLGEVEYVELSDRADFNDKFVVQLGFPQ